MRSGVEVRLLASYPLVGYPRHTRVGTWGNGGRYGVVRGNGALGVGA